MKSNIVIGEIYVKAHILIYKGGTILCLKKKEGTIPHCGTILPQRRDNSISKEKDCDRGNKQHKTLDINL